jgi:hypothetical protein
VVEFGSLQCRLLLRVIRCLPNPGQRGAFGGQASDKPQGRKPRAGICRTVLRTPELWGFEGREQEADSRVS